MSVNTQSKKYSPPSNKKNKKYDNDINLFPVLLKEQSNNSQKKTTTLSFAALVNNEKKLEITLPLKQEEKEKEAVMPGWVLIKKINGKINYKYGIMSDAYVNMVLENKRQEKEDNKKSFKKRLAQLQWDRDILNDLLGDISPHWNTKTLYETYNLEHLIKNNKNNQKADNEENEENEENNQKDDQWICI
jgi:hypothetical protein